MLHVKDQVKRYELECLLSHVQILKNYKLFVLITLNNFQCHKHVQASYIRYIKTFLKKRVDVVEQLNKSDNNA